MSYKAQVALLRCDKHEEEEMDIYCKTCQSPTCTECLKSYHQGHDFDTIPKLQRKIKNKRMGLIHGIKIKVNPVRTKNCRHIRNVKCRNETLLKRNIEKAEKKRAELHRAVDDIIDSHINCMIEHNQKLGAEINKEVERLQEDESEILQMLETLQKTTMTGLDLIEYYEKIRTKADTLQTLDISQYCSKQLFTQGELDCANLNKMIGQVTEISPGMQSVEMISSFQHSEMLVHTVYPVSDKEAWLTYSDPGDFSFLHRDGNHIDTVKNYASGLSFISHSDGFLICNFDRKNIMKVDMSGKSTIWIDTSPLEARFIGEALNGNVLITLIDEYSGSRTEQSQRIVRMVTPTGDTVNSYEFNENGATPVLVCPRYVSQNKNSDVCVVNNYEVTKGHWRGTICVFYEDGGMKFTYSGHDGEFKPVGICCDSLCNIICVNRIGSTIHVVGSEGSFQKYLFTHDTCVPKPYSLALHSSVLWVGSKVGEVRVYRYNYGTK